MCILDGIYCKGAFFQQRLLQYFGCTCIFEAAALGMALRSAFLLSLLALSLTLPFLAPHCGSQSGYLLSSGPESGEATASFRVFLVTPNEEQCNGKIPCHNVSFYSQNYTTGLSNAIFYFLPGNHTLSQNWNMYHFSNVTLCGRACFGEHHSIGRDEAEIHGSIQVSHSERVVVEKLTFKYCSSRWCLLLYSTVAVTVCNVSISHCTHGGILAINCENLTITQSNITHCDFGMTVSRYSNLETSHLYLSNISGTGIYVGVTEGVATFNHVREFEIGFVGFDVCFEHLDVEDSSAVLKRDVRINIFNSTITSWNTCGIALSFKKVGNTRADVNIASVSMIAMNSGRFGIYTEGGLSDYDTLKIKGSVHIHNVTITGLSDYCSFALGLYLFRNLTVSDITIQGNRCTAIYLFQSTALLQRNTTLTNNTAISGGGIYLEHDSFIVLDSSTRLQLCNNTAEKFGGGIYAEWNMYYCFAMSISTRAKPTIQFNGNRAYGSGQNLYGVIPGNCVPPSNNGKDYEVIRKSFRIQSKCNQTLISSDPLKVVPCNGFCVNTSNEAKDQYLPPIYPGQDFSLTLAAIGQEDGLTPAVILFHSNEILFHSQLSNMTKSIKAQCTTVTQKLELKTFITYSDAIIQITIADEKSPRWINNPLLVHIPVLPCPPGFTTSGSICDCTPSLDGLATCNITNKTIKRKGNSWIFPRNDSVLIFKNCPFDYCNNESFVIGNPSEQCDHNRSGILCGDCLPGYSLMLGSNQCRNCTAEGRQTTPVVIVLVSFLAGIGLVAVLIALNLTVSVGTMNGLLFFVNVVKLYEPVLRWDQFHSILRYVISWLNLDLGVPTCFYSGMTACHKIGLQFAFPVYLLSIVAVVIVMCNLGQYRGFSSFRFIRLLSAKASLLIGSKAVTVLATLLLLSYTKTLRTTIMIFHSATLIVTNCDENQSLSTFENLTVWYVNGSMAYGSDCHGILFWVAVGIFAPFLILFTLFLLFFPLMEKYLSRFRCWISWHMRLKPWYDAYGGPYKDEYRSWTGVLLIVRCVLALFTAFENNPLNNINFLAWVCLFLVALLSFTMAYENILLNALEIVYLFCLLLIAHFMTPPDEESDEANIVLWIMFSSLLLIVSYHIYHFLKEHPLFYRLALKAKNMYEKFRKKENEDEDTNDNTDDNCDANVKTVPSTVVSIYSDRYDELREPLLEPDP